ncbi:MAG: glycosyltransferase family 2 protein, partial [Alphaproteobacteria bacterium]
RRKAGLLKTKGFELTVVDNAENRGKVACLNQALGLVESDILAFSDISASLEPDALRRSMAWFNKAEVGVVAGGYALDRPMDEGEAAYWRYQTAVKQGEAALGAPLGVHGAFYAVRTALVEPLAADTINDDFILPMGIVAKGYRAIYDTGIRCAERETATRSMDFRRRQRIAAGNLQQVLRLPGLLISRQVGVAFCFLSGKALRAVMAPLLLIGGLGSAWLSVESMPFAVMTAIGLLGLALAGMGHAKLPLPKRLKRISAALAYLIAGHTAGLIGLMRFLAGGYRTPWVRASQASTQPLRASQ